MPLSPVELQAWQGLLRVHGALTGALDGELRAEHGLSLTCYEVLTRLADAPVGRLRMTELAESVLLSRSGLTRLVDRLEAEGLIERRECPDDARGAFATITRGGRSLLERARQTHLSVVRERFISRFDSEELRELVRHWDRVLSKRSR